MTCREINPNILVTIIVKKIIICESFDLKKNQI